MTRNPNIAAFVLLPAMAFLFMHALQHVYWLFCFREYAPGVITSVVLLLPTICYLTVKIIQQKYAPMWYTIAFAILITVGLIETVKARNTPPQTVRAFNQVGVALSNRL